MDEKKLAEVARWLEGSTLPLGKGARTFSVGVGVDRRDRVTVHLGAAWLGPNDSHQSTSRSAHGATLGEALSRLRVPRVRRVMTQRGSR